MKSLGEYRIYNIATTHWVCTQHIYSDGKGVIFIARGGYGHYIYHKINFGKYLVERVRLTSPKPPLRNLTPVVRFSP